MNLGYYYLAIGLALGALLFRLHHSWAIAVVALGALGMISLGLAYLRRWPHVLGKNQQGALLATSHFLFWPYHLMNWGLLLFFRWGVREPLFTEIVPGFFLGGRPLNYEAGKLERAGIKTVLDLTCEMSEAPRVRRQPGYYCLPLLDRTAPDEEQLAAGVALIQERLASGPVLVHCALGHGRSAAFAAAWLIASRKAGSAEEAVRMLQLKRPHVRLRGKQLEAVNAFAQKR